MWDQLIEPREFRATTNEVSQHFPLNQESIENCGIQTVKSAYDARKGADARASSTPFERAVTRGGYTVRNLQECIEVFLNGTPFAVVGASQNRSKYGNRVLRAYLQVDRVVHPVHPTVETVEGLKAYPTLASLPENVHGVSIITPPPVTEMVVAQAGEIGIKNIWLQPGAESDAAIEMAETFGMNIIARGPCLLVVLGYRE